MFNFEPLFRQLDEEGLSDWVSELRVSVDAALAQEVHGNLSMWKQVVESLPDVPDAVLDASDGVRLRGVIPEGQEHLFRGNLMMLHPWRKGPFDLFGTPVDTEWRSDWKWERLKDYVELRNRSVLDVGCGNGYYGWRMLEAGATRVLGLDPFLLYVMQHEAIKRYAGADAPNYVLPLADTCLERKLDLQAFDVTFSMGVLYHRQSPIDHLQTLIGTLKRGGQLVLETLVVEGEPDRVLMPETRYAKMRNVWFIPSIELLQLWLRRVGFRDIKVVDITLTSLNEQRSTPWMTFESLPDFLDPNDRSKTIEGYPAPLRAILTAIR